MCRYVKDTESIHRYCRYYSGSNMSWEKESISSFTVKLDISPAPLVATLGHGYVFLAHTARNRWVKPVTSFTLGLLLSILPTESPRFLCMNEVLQKKVILGLTGGKGQL